jgi:hypothetical protein
VPEWLPERHLARYIVEVVEGLNLRALERAYGGRGSAAYHQALLLALLIHGYETGFYSSRTIKRATYNSLAFRNIACNRHPDHDTLATTALTSTEGHPILRWTPKHPATGGDEAIYQRKLQYSDHLLQGRTQTPSDLTPKERETVRA